MSQVVGALNTSTLNRIPEELKQLKQWAPFTISTSGKKSPLPGFKVDTPESWITFEEVLEQCTAHGYMAAFVLTDKDPYVVLDLDSPKADNENASQIAADHLALVKIMGDTYIELSQSGQGYHVWLKGKLKKAVNNRLACTEIYTTGRFIICTGTSNSQPILEDQETVESLYEKFRLNHGKETLFVDQPQQYTDDELYNQCCARFPQRFEQLYITPTDNNSPTKSEDDHALIAMLCEFSDSLEQIHRLFLNSKRARRKHHLHPGNYITRSAGKTQKHRHLQVSVDALLKGKKPPAPTPVKMEEVIPPAPVNVFEIGYPEPMGLLKELVEHCLHISPYPDKDIALCGALAFMAGVIGRRYTMNSTALNIYLAVLAPSSHGKSAAGVLCDTLAHELSNPVGPGGQYQEHTPDAAKFFQTQIRSAPALFKNVLPKQQSFTWIVDELGKVEQVRQQRGNSNGTELQAALLELYSARMAGGHTVSEKSDQPVPRVAYPAVSVLGNSVETVFFDSLDEDSFTGGMFGRYFFVVVRRDKPYEQQCHNKAVDPMLRKKAMVLMGQGLQATGENMATNIQNTFALAVTPAAVTMIQHFSNDCVDQYNNWNRTGGLGQGPTGALWGRLAHKVAKLAGLHSVSRYAGDDRLLLETTIPTVDEIDVQWGIAFVTHEMKVLRTIAGEGGLVVDNGEKRYSSLLKSMRETYEKPLNHWSNMLQEKTAKVFSDYGAITKSGMHFLIKSKAGWSNRAARDSGFKSVGEMLTYTLREMVEKEELMCSKVGNSEYYWLPEFYPKENNDE